MTSDKARHPNSPRTIWDSINQLLHSEALGGILLILATVIALVWANSPLGKYYFELWEKTYLSINLGGFEISKNLHHWINDGLMVMFFFVVGLEIKREVLIGELSSPKKSAMPIAAAIGGMVVPALIYVGFNFGQDTIGGWGVPMATDIAFAIGIMALLGKKAPLSLKVFLTALAIVDDLGAVLVIALFYSSNIDVLNLVFGAIVLILMFGGNWAGIRNVMFYAVLGIGGLWPAFLLSGVHATVAGVLGALAIPTDMRINKFQFRDDLQALVQTFTKLGNPKSQVLEEEQLHTLNSVNKTIGKVQPTLQKLEHNMHPWVMYGVMPIFALANAGVVFTGDALGNMFQHPVSLGVFLGLLLGKVGGVTLFSWIAQKLRIADLPTGTNWVQVTGAGFMAGIGFTMSLFITALAFDSSEMQDFAKMGILFASLIAGVAGFLMIRNSNSPAPSEGEQH